MKKLVNLGFKKNKQANKIKKLKITKNEDAAITIDKKNSQNKFYTKIKTNIQGNRKIISEILHITPEIKTILKNNPEVLKFLETTLSKKKLLYSKFKIKNITISIKEIKNRGSGHMHNRLGKIIYKDKKTGNTKIYFLKEYAKLPEHYNATAEFLAVKEIEKYGFNIIKPKFAYRNKDGKSIILYDFTNLETYKEMVAAKKITREEKINLEKIFKNLRHVKELMPLNDFTDYNNDRYSPNANIFVKRLKDGRLKLYFSDLFWDKEDYYKKINEYL